MSKAVGQMGAGGTSRKSVRRKIGLRITKSGSKAVLATLRRHRMAIPMPSSESASGDQIVHNKVAEPSSPFGLFKRLGIEPIDGVAYQEAVRKDWD